MTFPTMLGSSLGLSRPWLHDPDDSRMFAKNYLNDFFPKDKNKKKTRRPAILYNTICWFFHNCESGCSRGDLCHFLHDEEPTDVVFHTEMHCKEIEPEPEPEPVYKRVPPGPVVDCRVYCGNIPPIATKETIENLIGDVCTVVLVDIMKGGLTHSPCSAGFVHITSKAQAQVAVDILNKSSIDGYNLYAKIQKTLPAAPGVSHRSTHPPKQLTKAILDKDGFTVTASYKKTTATAKTADSNIAQAPSGFALLSMEDDDVVTAPEVVSSASSATVGNAADTVDDRVADTVDDPVADTVDDPVADTVDDPVADNSVSSSSVVSSAPKGKAKMTTAQYKKELAQKEVDDIEAIVANLDAEEAEAKALQEARDSEVAKRMNETMKKTGKKKKASKAKKSEQSAAVRFEESTVETDEQAAIEEARAAEQIVADNEHAQIQMQIELDAKFATELSMPHLELVKGMDEISPDSVRGLNPWDESLRTQRMRNGLALFRSEDSDFKPERPPSRFSLQSSPTTVNARYNEDEDEDEEGRGRGAERSLV